MATGYTKENQQIQYRFRFSLQKDRLPIRRSARRLLPQYFSRTFYRHVELRFAIGLAISSLPMDGSGGIIVVAISFLPRISKRVHIPCPSSANGTPIATITTMAVFWLLLYIFIVFHHLPGRPGTG